MWYVLFAVIIALAGCDQEGRAPVQIEAAPQPESRPPPSLVSAMPPVDGRTVRFRITAPGGHPLYLENCNGAFSWGLEHQVAGSWRPAWIVPINGCHSSPIIIPSGEFRVFSQALSLGPGDDLQAGTYRIAVYELYSTHTDDVNHAASVQVPHELSVSEPLALDPLPAR